SGDVKEGQGIQPRISQRGRAAAKVGITTDGTDFTDRADSSFLHPRYPCDPRSKNLRKNRRFLLTVVLIPRMGLGICLGKGLLVRASCVGLGRRGDALPLDAACFPENPKTAEQDE